MALTVGELVAYAQLDKSNFNQGTRGIANDMRSLQSETTGSMRSMESTITRSMADIEQAIADGLDPAAAIADLDRLEQELDASLAEMLAEADSFAAELEREIDAAFDALDDDAKEAGRKAGEQLADGLEDGLRDAPDEARKQGRKSGQEFGDGVEDGGGGRGGGGRMAGIGSNMVSGLKAGALGLAAGAGAAIGSALASAIGNALEREDIFAELAVKVGAFGAESERLGRLAGELYADAYGESLEEVTGALARVLQNIDGAGKLGDDALKRMTGQALTVARVMDEDVSAVTRAVSQMLRNDLSPSAKDAFDTLVRGQQEGVNKSEDLLDTFNEYSTIFRDLGLDAEDALGLMAQGLKAGARDSDTVADALKELDIRVKDLSAKDALKKLGLDADQMASAFAKGGPTARKALDQILEKLGAVKDPAERSRLAVELFGTKAEDMAKSINSLNLDEAKSKIGDFKGAVDEAGKTLGDTSKADADRWSRSWEGAFATAGDLFMTQLQSWIPSPSDMEAKWGELSGWFSGTVGPFFADAWASVSTTTQEIWTGIGDWLSTKASEIVSWLQGVPGKIAGFFTSGWADLRAKTVEAWEGLKSGATQKASELVTWLQSVPGKIAGFFTSGWADLKSSTVEAWEGLKSGAIAKANELVTSAKEIPSKVKAVFASAGTWLLQAGRDAIQGFINGVREKAQQAVDAVRGIGQSVIDAAKKVIDSHSPSKVFEQIGKWTVEGLVKGLRDNEQSAVDTVKGMVGKIKEAFSSQPDVADGLVKFVSIGNDSLAALAKQREDLVNKLAAAKEMAKQVAGSAQEWAEITGLKAEDFSGGGDLAAELQNRASAINNFANNIQTLAKRGLNKAVIQQIIDAGVEKGATFAEMLVGSDGSEIKALNKAQAQVEKASKKLGKVSADAMFDTGKKAGEGYLKGLQESLKKLDDEMEKIVKALVAAIKKHLKIKSPSQVMAEIGGQTVAGLAVGMTDATGEAVAAIQQVAANVASAAAGSLAGMVPGQLAPTGGGQYGIAFGGGGIDYKGPQAGGTPATTQGTVINVDMSGSTIREPADVQKLGAQFGFEYKARA
ncbi:phage tail tape measure protein [Nonomuraea bangladeshensis]|uniref:phage tail tape measure protein n=1 Tax=Nonomuraea bangladeshensis TaxID=404385 RepID=UPI003C2D941E